MRILFLFLIVTFLASCGDDSSELLVLSESDSTGTFELEAGEQFEVRLESNASTGYTWEIAGEPVPAVVELRTREYREPGGDLVGAAGEDVFVFEAIGDAAVLRLEYVRPFDDPVIPERIAEFIIRVDDAPWPPETSDPPTTSSETAPMQVTELLDFDGPAPASVIGYVVIDDAGARLCEALAESFPPQCGGSSVTITNPEVLTIALESEQSVQWTDVHVRLDGSYDGTDFTAEE